MTTQQILKIVEAKGANLPMTITLGKGDLDLILQAANLPHQRILADQPVDKDSLGFASFVRTMCDVAFSESTQTPLGIAIDGELGSGKTSIMRMMEAQAKMAGLSCVWLSASHGLDLQTMLAAMPAEVRKQVKRLRIDRGVKPRRLLLPSIMSLGYHLGRPVDQIVRRLFHFYANFRLRSAWKRSLRDAVGARVIIFMDDLDRASPQQLDEVMCALDSIQRASRCVVVFSMNREHVARSLSSFRRQHVQAGVIGEMLARQNQLSSIPSISSSSADEGYPELDRHVQLSLPVPRLTRNAVWRYVTELQLNSEVSDIFRWVPDVEIVNPRNLKRYVNSLNLALQIITHSELSPEINKRYAVQALALRRSYPDIYHSLRHDVSISNDRVESLVSRAITTSQDNAHAIALDLIRYCMEIVNSIALKAFEKFINEEPYLRLTFKGTSPPVIGQELAPRSTIPEGSTKSF